jgi:hypothetical protein
MVGPSGVAWCSSRRSAASFMMHQLIRQDHDTIATNPFRWCTISCRVADHLEQRRSKGRVGILIAVTSL